MSKYYPNLATSPRVGGGGVVWAWGGIQNGTNRNVDFTFIFDFRLLYTPYTYIAPFGHNAQRGRRQTDQTDTRSFRNEPLFYAVASAV